jgi:hypothetical protein
VIRWRLYDDHPVRDVPEQVLRTARTAATGEPIAINVDQGGRYLHQHGAGLHPRSGACGPGRPDGRCIGLPDRRRRGPRLARPKRRRRGAAPRGAGQCGCRPERSSLSPAPSADQDGAVHSDAAAPILSSQTSWRSRSCFPRRRVRRKQRWHETYSPVFAGRRVPWLCRSSGPAGSHHPDSSSDPGGWVESGL